MFDPISAHIELIERNNVLWEVITDAIIRAKLAVNRFIGGEQIAHLNVQLFPQRRIPVILYCLMEFETVRFNELKRYLKTISDKTLSTNLKELEADKLIIRTEYPQIPPKVEYTLSERGKTLMTVLDQLCVWGEENRLTE